MCKRYFCKYFLSTIYMYAFDLQDEDIVAQNICILKEIETKLSDAVTGARNALKNAEGNLMKKCILRRGASLYMAMKKIKGSKKPKPTFAHRKNHGVNNKAGNSAIICTIKSEVEGKSFLNIDHYRSNKSNVAINDTLEPRLNTRVCASYASKKLTAMDSSAKTHISSEETTVIKYGAKRLKITSKIPKALPEIGESSSSIEDTNAKVSLKMLRTCDKQSIKEMRDRVKIDGCMKANRSKLKEMKTKENSALEHKIKS